MAAEKVIKKQRKKHYKNLRKLRKARDVASAAKKNKKHAWKLSRVARRFQVNISSYNVKELAYLIYRYMPEHLNPPQPPIRKK